jgi:glycosyltransferase involved in cell wall biosynthesis
MTEICFYVPCLNEEKNIKNSLKTIFDCCLACNISNYEIIIFNDGSSDNSLNEIKDFQSTHFIQGKIKLINNKKPMGLGYNYIEGAYITNSIYYIMVCGDNSENAENLSKIISLRGQADIIIPNFLNNDSRNFLRRFLSKFFTFIINIITGNNISYYNGIVLHKTHNVRRWHSLSSGFGYQAELIVNLLYLKKSYKEVSIQNIDRKDGFSRGLNLLNLFSVLHSILQIILRTIRKKIWDI